MVMLKQQIQFAFACKDRIAKKHINKVYKYVTAMTEADKDNRLRELDSNYGFMQQVQKDYLKAVYTRSYVKGYESVDDDIFTNTSRPSQHDLEDRFNDYPKIKSPDWDFIEKLSASKADALEELLGSSSQAGFEKDFTYYVYEKYFIDGSRELEEADVEVPEGLEDDKVYFISQMAYADGVEKKVNELASAEVQRKAEELMEEKP